MKIKGKNNLLKFIYLSLGSVFFLALVFCYAQPEEMEFGVYSAFARSFLSDGDLNIVNQIPKEATWILSPTFSYPSYFDHGHTIFWLPFIAYEKLLAYIFPNFSLTIRTSSFLFAIMGAFFCALSFLLLKGMPLTQENKNPLKNYLTVLAIFPSVFCLVISPSNSDITAMFVASLFLYSLIQLEKETKSSLLVGLLAAILVTIKISLFFYLPFLLFWVLQFSSIKSKIKQTLALLLGSFSILVLYVCNTILKYGHWEFPYSWLKETSTLFIPGITIWGEAGYLQQNPGIILVGTSAFILWAFFYKKDNKTMHWFLALSFATISLQTISFSHRFFMTQSSYPLARNILFFLPLFYVFLTKANEHIRPYKKSFYTFNFVLLISAFWSIAFQFALTFYSRELITWPEVFHGAFYLKILETSLPHLYLLKNNFKNFLSLVLVFTPLIGICYFAFICIKKSLNQNTNLLPRLILILALSYGFISTLNILNHHKNTERWLNEGCYQKQSIGRSVKLFAFDELNDITNLSKYYYLQSGNHKYLPAVDEWEMNYQNSLKNDFIFDPQNNANKIKTHSRITYWSKSQEYWDNFLKDVKLNNFCRRI